jgi:hypothetical protein
MAARLSVAVVLLALLNACASQCVVRLLSEHDTRAEYDETTIRAIVKGDYELLVAYLLPTELVAAYSVPLVGGAFLWGGEVYRRGTRPRCRSVLSHTRRASLDPQFPA